MVIKSIDNLLQTPHKVNCCSKNLYFWQDQNYIFEVVNGLQSGLRTMLFFGAILNTGMFPNVTFQTEKNVTILFCSTVAKK